MDAEKPQGLEFLENFWIGTLQDKLRLGTNGPLTSDVGMGGWMLEAENGKRARHKSWKDTGKPKNSNSSKAAA